MTSSNFLFTLATRGHHPAPASYTERRQSSTSDCFYRIKCYFLYQPEHSCPGMPEWRRSRRASRPRARAGRSRSTPSCGRRWWRRPPRLPETRSTVSKLCEDGRWSSLMIQDPTRYFVIGHFLINSYRKNSIRKINVEWNLKNGHINQITSKIRLHNRSPRKKPMVNFYKFKI